MNKIENIKSQNNDHVLPYNSAKNLSRINWKEHATNDILNLIKSLNSSIGVYTYLNGKRVKFWKANGECIKEENIQEWYYVYCNLWNRCCLSFYEIGINNDIYFDEYLRMNEQQFEVFSSKFTENIKFHLKNGRKKDARELIEFLSKTTWFEKELILKNIKNKYNFINYDDYINLKNGTIFIANAKDGLYIKCKDGYINILEIQIEGAKRMSISDYLRGHNIEKNSMFE